VNVQSILAAKGSAVATIDASSSLAQATASLRDHGVGALVVSSGGGAIEGIISERDVVRALAAHGGGTLGRTVSSAMSSDVVTCRPADTVDELMALMTARRFRHVPVVDDDGSLIGIVSIGDVVKYRLGELEHENQALFDYIHGR
jgi:CBS domain-containing protein